jgi:hypothetical protein
MASASATASAGSASRGSTMALVQRGAIPAATKRRASSTLRRSCFDADSARDQQLADIEDAVLPLVGRDEVW